MNKRLLAAALVAFLLGSAMRAAVDLKNFDPAVKPQDDFFRYVNGTWLKTVVIPPDQARWANFIELQQRNWNNVRAICERAAAKGAQGTAIERLVGDFYASGMDEAAIGAAGATPLRPELERIAAVRTPDEVLRAIARLHLLGVVAGFRVSVDPDDKDSRTELLHLQQGGLGLASSDLSRDADRDNYFNVDEKSTALRGQYVAHIAQMFELLGDAPATAQSAAAAAMKLETALAGGSSTRVQLRDPQTNYHKFKMADLARETGGLDWPVYFTALGVPAVTEADAAQPEFFKVLATQLTQTSAADWRAYLRWHLIRRVAPFLGGRFTAENFKFFGTAMTGSTEPSPHWKQVAIVLDQTAGEALGQLYVADYFPPAAKVRVLELVANVRAAMRERLRTVEWMDDATRARAVAKLDAFSVKMGYPEKWKDYSTVHLDRGPYVLNIFRASEAETRRQLAKIGRPVDPGEWSMTPPTVNAYYSPQLNGITFPAGILQPPYFDAKADDALNYGGIGAIIGHEMSHGFDDSGRQYDAHGNLADWWTPESAARFKERAAGIVKQFAGYTVPGGAYLNGELTQGENIADLTGLKIAYAALEKTLAGRPREKIDGFTPEQRFFISHATVWRDIMRDAEYLRRARVDPHSPGVWRVNGPLSNLDEFARAFDVPEGAPMRRPPAERVEIW